MATAPATTEALRRAVHRRTHARCFACGEETAGGLGLRFHAAPDGSVAAEWRCPDRGQGFDGVMHGGLIATILDGAMVHTLFARGIEARTAELRVRYRRPVRTGLPLTVAARVTEVRAPLWRTEGEVRQGGAVCATARASFMANPGENRA